MPDRQRGQGDMSPLHPSASYAKDSPHNDMKVRILTPRHRDVIDRSYILLLAALKGRERNMSDWFDTNAHNYQCIPILAVYLRRFIISFIRAWIKMNKYNKRKFCRILQLNKYIMLVLIKPIDPGTL